MPVSQFDPNATQNRSDQTYPVAPNVNTPTPDVDMSKRPNNGLLRVLSNQDIELKEKRDRDAAEALQYKPEISNLASYVRNHWDAAKRNKMEIEERLLKCLRQRKGQYDPDDLRHIQNFGGSQIFMMITNAKCRTIESWIRDVLIPAGDKPWSLDPTPEPTIAAPVLEQIRAQVGQEAMMVAQTFGADKLTAESIDERIDELKKSHEQEIRNLAEKEADRIERRIDDHFNEGDFYTELSAFIKDFATYPAAFMKGPIVRRKKMLSWEESPNSAITGKIPTVNWKYKRTWKRVSPFDIYLAPAARHLQDGYLIERQKYRQRELVKMKGVPGFSEDAINEVLWEHDAGILKDWLWTDQERANLEGRPNEQDDPDAIVEVLEYHGDIPGWMLLEWGIDKKKIRNPADPVPAVCILVGRWVIMARINEDPYGEKPYYSAAFDSSNDSVWGEAAPEIMEDCQRACNAFARAIINNAAIASGPQVEVQRDRLDAGENPQKLYPWKIWFTKSDTLGKNREAIHFFQPNMMTDALMKAYEYFFGQAGEQLGVPAYEQGLGNVAGGAGKTAHGLSMLMNAASKVMKDAIVDIDSKVIKKVVYNTWIHTVLYDEDVEYQGDINVVARASEYLVVAEMLQARRQEFLAMTNNPNDMAIIGIDGRAKVLREIAKGLKLKTDIIPEDADLEAKLKMSMMQQAGGVAPPAGGAPVQGGLNPQPTAEDNGGALPPIQPSQVDIAAAQ